MVRDFSDRYGRRYLCLGYRGLQAAQVKYLETKEAKECRRIVLNISFEERELLWEDPQLEAAASEVCSHFDVLAAMIEFDHCDRWLPGHGYATFFRREWGNHIVNSYNILEPYIHNYRTVRHDPTRFRPFQRLAERVIRDMEAPAFGRWLVDWL